MSDAIFEAYYKHLLNTNIIGRTYRKFYLYPRIAVMSVIFCTFEKG